MRSHLQTRKLRPEFSNWPEISRLESGSKGTRGHPGSGGHALIHCAVSTACPCAVCSELENGLSGGINSQAN